MRRVMNLRLPSESESSSETEHRVFMSGLIDFNLECVVRAAGALLHFLDEFGVGLTNLVTIQLVLSKLVNFQNIFIN